MLSIDQIDIFLDAPLFFSLVYASACNKGFFRLRTVWLFMQYCNNYCDPISECKNNNRLWAQVQQLVIIFVENIINSNNIEEHGR